jgi:hypothetical protein
MPLVMRDKAIALLSAALLVAAGTLHRDATEPVAVDITNAVQAVRTGDDTAARATGTTEAVRYDDVNLELQGAYVVADGRMVGQTTVAPSAERAWSIAVRVLPASQLDLIRQFNAVSDGTGGTLAMVHRSTVVPDDWVLSIDVAETNDVIEATLVHELAHMLTLGRADVSAAGGRGCDGVALAIGCARHGSALDAWSSAFWPGIAEPAPYEPSRFVTPYAASAVHEDLAESFLEYVLGSTQRSPAIEAKLAFFDQRPEFVAARQAVLANLNRA